jgi:Domain of unknown function (DUF4402)
MATLMIGAKSCKKGMRFVCVTAVATLAMVSPARAETETVDAQVAIVTRGEFFKVEDLHFGVVIPSSLPGVITLTPAGVRTATGGVTLVGNLHHPAEFAGRRPGNNNNPVQISIGSATTTLTGPGAPMLVTLFRGNTSPGQVLSIIPRNFQVQGQSNGAFELTVGATLAVNGSQAPGTYTGNWTITLDFQ